MKIKISFIYICLLVGLLGLNGQSLPPAKMLVADSLVIKELWTRLNGSKWQYPADVTEDQKWFNGKTPMNTWVNLTTELSLNAYYVSGISYSNYMVPEDKGLVHYNLLNKLTKISSLVISDCPNVKLFTLDSLNSTNLINLTTFEFANNNALGKLKTGIISKMTNLTTLNLSNNRLTDTIPYRDLSGLKIISSLDFSNNKFIGAFDPIIFNMITNTSNASSFNFSNNQLNSIVSRTINQLSNGISINLSYNRISNDNGFVSKFFNTSSISFSLYIHNNLLPYNSVFPSATLAGWYKNSNYFYSYSYPIYRNIGTLPQVLNPDTLKYDIVKGDSIVVPTGFSATAKLPKLSILRHVPAVNPNSEAYTYFTDSLTKFNIKTKVVSGKYFLIVKPNKIDSSATLLDFSLVYNDSLRQNYYSDIYYHIYDVQVRTVEKSYVDIKALNQKICNNALAVDKVQKFGIYAYGVLPTDSGTITLKRRIYNLGVAKDSSITLSLKNSTLLSNKSVEFTLPMLGDSASVQITSLSLYRNSKAVTITYNTNAVKVSKSLPAKKTLISDKYACQFDGNYAKAKFANPEAGVNYSLKNVSNFYSYNVGDSVYFDFNVSDTSDIVLYGDIEGLCATPLDTQKVLKIPFEIGLENYIDTVAVTTLTCSTPAKIVFKNTFSDFYYYPSINGIDKEKYRLSGASDTSKTITFSLPAYEFSENSGNSLLIKYNHKVCTSSSNQTQINKSFDFVDNLKVSALDSVALVSFVKRNDTIGKQTWHSRDIYYYSTEFDYEKYAFKKLKEWKQFNGSKILNIVCGRVVGLNLNDYSYPIGGEFDLHVTKDSLSELRTLDISYNYFTGNLPQAQYLGKCDQFYFYYNSFSDTALMNYNTVLNYASITAYKNNLTFISLLNLSKNNSNFSYNSQNSVNVDTTIQKYEGNTFTFKNPVPDTKDGKIKYSWKHIVNSDVSYEVSTDRDLVINNLKLSNAGVYKCEMTHEDMMLSGDGSNYLFTLTLEGLTLNVNTCSKPSNFAAYINSQLNSSTSCVSNTSKDTVNLNFGCVICRLASTNVAVTGTATTITTEYSWYKSNSLDSTKGFIPKNDSLSTKYALSTADKVKDSLNFVFKTDIANGACLWYDTVTLKINKLPEIIKFSDTTICKYSSKLTVPVKLKNAANASVSWNYTNSNAKSLKLLSPYIIQRDLSTLTNIPDSIQLILQVNDTYCKYSSIDTATVRFRDADPLLDTKDPMSPADSISLLTFIKKAKGDITVFSLKQPQKWEGVKTLCGRVLELSLPNKGLKDTIAGINNLTYLQKLDLSYNSLKFLDFNLSSDLNYIKVLNLKHNNLNNLGIITNSYYYNLQRIYLDTFDLSENNIQAPYYFYYNVPRFIDLSNGAASSITISNSYGTIKTKYLDISHNNLLDSYTDGLNFLDSLEYFDISHNKFKITGKTLSEISKKLKHVDLSYNQLNGTFAIDTLKDLEYLDVSHNYFSSVPQKGTNLKSCKSLKHFDIGNNRLVNVAFKDTLTALNNLKFFAVDSNSVYKTFASRKADSSGIISLPVLPASLTDSLYVQYNHLYINELVPYKELLKNYKVRYEQQYDTIGLPYTIKPALGTKVVLNSGAFYITDYGFIEWYKNGADNLTIPHDSKNLTIASYASTDAGKYSFVVGNNDLKFQTYYRRPITLDLCKDTYTMVFKTVAKQNTCGNLDSLKAVFSKLNSKGFTYNFNWGLNEKAISGANQKQLKLYVPGKYYYVFYDSTNQCYIRSQDTLITSLNSLEPVIKDSVLKNDTIVYMANLAHLSDTAKYRFQWFVNGYAIAGAEHFYYRPYYNGNYSLNIVDTLSACATSSSPLAVLDFSKTFVRSSFGTNTKGQVVLTSPENISLYPSPAKTELRISGLEMDSEINIVNSQGENLYHKVNSRTDEFIDTSELPSGMYLLHVLSKNINTWKKLVIEK